MKKITRIASLLLSVILCAGSLVSCGKDRTDGEQVEKATVLTNVFKGTKSAIPDEYYLNNSTLPLYDAETGTMKLLAQHSYESDEMTEDGYKKWISENKLLTIAADGSITEEKTLDFGEDDVYVNNGLLSEDKLYFTHSIYDHETGSETVSLCIYDLGSGTLSRSEPLNDMFSPTDRGWFYINGMALDGEGNIYLNADREILVIDDSFKKQFTLSVQTYIERMVTSADGKVYISSYMDGGQQFMPIDTAKKDFGDPIDIPDELKASEYFFGGGHDIYFLDRDRTALYGYDIPETETVETAQAELIMDFANSDLYANNIEIVNIISDDKIILYERDPVNYDNHLMVYDRSPDIDLSQIKVLEIAYVRADYDLQFDIISFNKANDGVRIIARDYSSYNSDEDPSGGQRRLLNDMLNGLYKPDMITSTNLSDPVISQVYSNSLYTDLYGFIDKSTKVKRDDLLGCIMRTFGTSDGKLWGIGANITVQTLIGPKSVLGDREGWTLREFIDFAESLPEDVLLMENLTQGTAPHRLMGANGYGMFIDTENNTCNFESEDFIAYLNFLKTLPETYEDIDQSFVLDYDQMYKLYHNGKIALRDASYYGINDFLSEEVKFNTKDIVRIGYPTKDGKGGSLPIETAPYIITSFCEYPTEAWSFIESIIAPELNENMYHGGHNGYPVLKSHLDYIFEEYYTYKFSIDINGTGMSWGPYDPDRESEFVASTGGSGREQIDKFFTKDDAANLLDWLDNDIGCPITANVDLKITEIVQEEISEYLGGVRSAEECAKMIQSRVNIWLAEHE